MARVEGSLDRDRLRKLLRQVRQGKLGIEEALQQLRHDPVVDLGFARLDLHRAVRRGFPEVIFGPGKTTEQILTLARHLRDAGQTVMVTRVGPEVHEALVGTFPRAEYHAAARIVVVRNAGRRAARPGVVVVGAGTSDIPVCEEAAVTAETMGNRVTRVHDVGISGLHRLAEHLKTLQKARVIVVVAGMEGALPSVVAGLTDCPVIAVPTSVGCGAGGGGQAALLAMLNSCAAGLTVVNIDNGFGAGYAASLINRK